MLGFPPKIFNQGKMRSDKNITGGEQSVGKDREYCHFDSERN